MPDNELGRLSPTDPLYPFLTDVVLRRVLGLAIATPVFDARPLHPRHLVRYTERRSGVDLVGKFFSQKLPVDPPTPGPSYFRALVAHEFANLCRVRALGFDHGPYRVVRPLAVNELLDYVLVEEFAAGPTLDHVIRAALAHHDHAGLYARLTDLAGFLAQLHRRSATGRCADGQVGLSYLGKLLGQLAANGVISRQQQVRLDELRSQWAAGALLHTAPEVLNHGDATPVNFVFGGAGEVVALDLERVRAGDGLTDVGCVAAELKHAFFLTTGDPVAGEPFIQHLYACYAAQLAVSPAEFGVLTARGRFWMGVFELRIARNAWLDVPYRHRLVAEAERCLGG